MIVKVIAPRHLFYYHTVVCLMFLLSSAAILTIIVFTFQIIPMIFAGVFCVIGIILTQLHFKRQVLVEILPDNTIYYSTFFTKAVVSLADVTGLKEMWSGIYLVNFKARRYYFFASRNDVDYLMTLVKNSTNFSEKQT